MMVIGVDECGVSWEIVNYVFSLLQENNIKGVFIEKIGDVLEIL